MTTDLKELIERLRSVDADMNDEYGGGKGPSLFQEAADALEAELCAFVKPLVAARIMRHAFFSGFLAAREIPAHEECSGLNAWANYKPYEPFDNAITIRSASDVAAEARAGAIEAAAYVARNACLVPPDGGSPTQAEADVCDEAYRRIRAIHDTDTLAAIERIKREAVGEFLLTLRDAKAGASVIRGMNDDR